MDYLASQKINTQDDSADKFLNTIEESKKSYFNEYDKDKKYSPYLNADLLSKYNNENGGYYSDRFRKSINYDLRSKKATDGINAVVDYGKALLENPSKTLEDTSKALSYGMASAIGCTKEFDCLKESAGTLYFNLSERYSPSYWNKLSGLENLYGYNVHSEAGLISSVRNTNAALEFVPFAKAGSAVVKGVSLGVTRGVSKAGEAISAMPNLQTGKVINPYIDNADFGMKLPKNYQFGADGKIVGPKGGEYYLVGREANGSPVHFNNQKFFSFENGVKQELKGEAKVGTKVEMPNEQYNWIEKNRNTDNPQGFLGYGKVHPNNSYFTQSAKWQAPQKGSGLEYRVYQQEIDLNLRPFVDKGSLKTNEELMKKGYAPYVVKDGKYEQLQLHHSRQDGRGGLFELTKETHLYKTDQTGRKALHPYGNNNSHPEFPVERSLFDIDRPQYWQDRLNKLKGN